VTKKTADVKPLIQATTAKPPAKFNMKSFSKALENIDLDEKISFHCVDTDYSNAIHIQLMKQTCFFYRDEIKNFILLCRVVSRSRERFNGREWSFLEKLRA
jgi:hypothetical protein